MFRFRRPHVVLTLVLCFVAIPMLIVSGQRRNAGFSRENGNVPATNLFNVVQSAVECQAAASPATTQYTFNNAVRGTNDAFFSHATKNNLLIAVASSSDPATITMFSTGYTQVFQQPATTGAPATGAPAIAMFYKISDGSETTATFNFSASTRPCIGLIEYSGASINAPLHGKSLGYNGSGTVVALGTGTIDIISANDLGVAFFANNTNTTTASNYTAPPGGLFVN
ncbi:MAG: hypothetical protein JO314_13685, partial [Acidobacteria bacterium]|nr:hypothetical protein [Acidobacteriota bacterium]